MPGDGAHMFVGKKGVCMCQQSIIICSFETPANCMFPCKRLTATTRCRTTQVQAEHLGRGRPEDVAAVLEELLRKDRRPDLGGERRSDTLAGALGVPNPGRCPRAWPRGHTARLARQPRAHPALPAHAKVDSADLARLADCGAELRSLLQEERLMGATLLVLANKQDIPSALTLPQIEEVRGGAGLFGLFLPRRCTCALGCCRHQQSAAPRLSLIPL